MEDFVTSEIAEKLKEKGFYYPCIAHYDINKELKVVIREPIFWHSEVLSYTDAPTISQVLKWLREEKGISLNVYPSYFANLLYWTCDVLSFIGEIRIEKRLGDDVKTYEEAAICGIEYVLDNLI